VLGAPTEGAPAPAPDASSDPTDAGDLGFGGSLANHADDRHVALPPTSSTSTPDHATATAGPTAPATPPSTPVPDPSSAEA
jgi:hypothetical protein